MSASLSQQLEDLLNPLPKFTDPEDDPDEVTTARVIDRFDEDGNESENLNIGRIKRHASTFLFENDRRYFGKPTSRKALRQEAGDMSHSEESGDDMESEEKDDGSLESEESGDSSEVSEDASKKQLDCGSQQHDLDAVKGEEIHIDSLVNGSKEFSFQQISDLEKFTEGMDDIGESDEEDIVSEDYSDQETESEDDDGDEEEDLGQEEEDMEEEEEKEEYEDDKGVLAFSKQKLNEEVWKGRAVKNQIALWDHILEGRIKLQKALLTANQLPQPDIIPIFKKKGGQEFATALKSSYKALKALLRTLVELQNDLLYQYPETKRFVDGSSSKPESGEEIPSDGEVAEDEEENRKRRPAKRKLEMDEYPDFMAKRFADFKTYRNATLQKWHDKTKLASGKIGKGFSAFDRSVLTQIDQIMMDKERLLRRTQTKRSIYKVLGKPEQEDQPVLEEEPGETEILPTGKANAHLKDLDEEIFDDDDFYHQLLRELIERKTSVLDPNDQVAMGRQWLAIQKLRSKIKKKVDTKASKGRKIRYHVHSKLVSFMAPVEHSTMNDDARTELYRSLFGKIKPAEAE